MNYPHAFEDEAPTKPYKGMVDYFWLSLFGSALDPSPGGGIFSDIKTFPSAPGAPLLPEPLQHLGDG